MRNIIEKSNKTKFDYNARKLGIFGIVLMSFTFIFGGVSIANVIKENNYLINTIANTDVEETKMQKNQETLKDNILEKFDLNYL